MADEATIRYGFQVTKGNLNYRSSTKPFKADVSLAKGPSPGTILCAVAPGTDVDLSELTTPGWAEVINLDSTNYVSIGMYDPQLVMFWPMLELQPGEGHPLRLSRNLFEEFATGTGTVGAGTNTLRIVADTAACQVYFGAFNA